MKDKTVLITGGTGGIGKYTAIGLAQQGARVVVTGRNRERGEKAVREIIEASSNPQVELLLGDLTLQGDVRALAQAFKNRYDRLDVLINNFGLLTKERTLTADGVEALFAANTVTPFLLTHELLDLLKASGARVVNVTGGMPSGKLDLNNLQSEVQFQGLPSYTNVKVAMMAMSVVLAQKLEGSGVSVNVCYPGGASTAMTQAMTPTMLPWFMRPFYPLFKFLGREDGGKSAAKAARSSIYLASSPELEGVTGAYFNTQSKQVAWPKSVLEPDTQEQVWALCEALTKVEMSPIPVQATPSAQLA